MSTHIYTSEETDGSDDEIECGTLATTKRTTLPRCEEGTVSTAIGSVKSPDGWVMVSNRLTLATAVCDPVGKTVLNGRDTKGVVE